MIAPVRFHDYRLVTLPRALADLIDPPASAPYTLIRPAAETPAEVADWLLRAHATAWKEAGEQTRRLAAGRLLFAVWRHRHGEMSDGRD